MKKLFLISSFTCLLTFSVSAAPPKCKTVDQNGTTLEVCSREDTECYSKLVKEQESSPSSQWNGCAWPAKIIKGHFTAVGLIVFSTNVSIVPSYRDSERVDMTITIERPDHTFVKYDRKDVPVIVDEKNSIPSASAEVVTQFDPLGVTTVDATEKGGAKGANHSYR